MRDILYISDLIDAYDRFIKGAITHGVFNIGGGSENTVSLLELLNYLEEKEGISFTKNFSDWRSCDQKVYISNIAKINKALNWAPCVSPQEGISQLVQWVRDNKKLFT